MREKDLTLRIYEPKKKPNRFKISKKTHPLIDEIAESEVLFPSDDLSGESMLTNYLHSNPFLYNPVSNDIEVHSIEDFIITVKKEKMALGDIIRNPKFKPRQRKRIISRSFSLWKKDYINKKNKTFKENDKVVAIIDELSFYEYKRKEKLFLLINLILLLIFVITDSIVWNYLKQNNFGYSIYNIIIVMYNNAKWLKIIGNIGIYITLLLFFYNKIYSSIITDFKKNYKLAQSFLTNSEITISKDFRRKYKKAKRYYLKRVNNKKYPYFPPLNIEEVQEGKMNITIFNEICSATVDRAYIVKKSKPYITAVKKTLTFMGYASALTIIVMFLYNVIISIFQ